MGEMKTAVLVEAYRVALARATHAAQVRDEARRAVIAAEDHARERRAEAQAAQDRLLAHIEGRQCSCDCNE